MTRPAIAAAAAAILEALPAGRSFPTIGIIRSMTIGRKIPGTDTTAKGLITSMVLNITTSDRVETVQAMWAGALAAEVEAVMQAGGAAADFVGRRVKVELIDGQLIAAYTVNGEN